MMQESQIKRTILVMGLQDMNGQKMNQFESAEVWNDTTRLSTNDFFVIYTFRGIFLYLIFDWYFCSYFYQFTHQPVFADKTFLMQFQPFWSNLISPCILIFVFLSPDLLAQPNFYPEYEPLHPFLRELFSDQAIVSRFLPIVSSLAIFRWWIEGYGERAGLLSGSRHW